MATDNIFSGYEPVECEIMGARGVITGGKYHVQREAVYVGEDYTNTAIKPGPAATPVVEISLELQVTMLWSPGKTIEELIADLQKAGVPLNVSTDIRGMQ